ncbi:MAG: MerR family transcriptional regulator [Bryobacteraceae bacterium]|nr:MerR family transcriptional regulator [Bryobacteraceae bacterium]
MFKTKPRSSATLPGERVFSSADVARLAGVSLRQLQWWDEQKVVSPRHEGHRRIYGPAEVAAVSVIAELRHKGFSLQKIRRVLRPLHRELGRRIAEVAAGTDLFLLTDGKSVHVLSDRDRILELLLNARQPMYLVSISDQYKKLTGTPRKPVRSEAPAAAASRRSRAQ